MRKSVIAGLTALFSLAAFAGNEFSVSGRTASAPIIDGELNDPCWKNSVEITNFVKLRKTGTTAEKATKIYLVHDEKNLYIGIFCRENLVNPVFNKLNDFRADTKSRDDKSIWKDDMVEIFLAPDAGNASRYYHIACNSRGTVYDALKMDAGGWDSGAAAAAKRVVKGSSSADDASGWSAEIAIPFSSLGTASPRAGTKWKANFCRNAPSIKEVSSWTKTAGRFHDPFSFGTIEFRDFVPGITEISSFSTLSSGKNIFRCSAADNVEIDVTAEFPKDTVHFTAAGKNSIRIPFTLDPENKAYQFTAKTEGDPTETFLRSGNLNFSPNKTYTISLRTKTDYTSTLGKKGYAFLTIVQKVGGYQPTIRFPESTNGEWRTLTGQFSNKDNTSGTLWGLKWTKRLIRGTVFFDDISIVENETGKEILDNGNFSGGARNWNIFNRKNYVPGYGFGAESAKISYRFKDLNGNLLYQSPEYDIKLVKENSQIHSSVVQFGDEGLLPLEKIQICAGTMERVSLYLKSDCKNTFSNAKITITTPYGIRLLPPDEKSIFSVPESITEKIIERNGQKLRQYSMVVPADAVNNPDTDYRVASGIPIYLLADTPERGTVGTVEYSAELDPGRRETSPHQLRLEVLAPPAGIVPSHKLPLVLWVYLNSMENKLMSEEQEKLLIRKAAFSGYNMSPVGVENGRKISKFGLHPFPMLPAISLSGPFFPGAEKFVKENPEYAGIDAFGKRTRTIDPAVLLSQNNPFRPNMEKVIAEYMKHFPDELHVDYEAGFLPSRKGTLPRRHSITGFSARNLSLFKKAYRISESLTPDIIFEKYPDQWRDFRNGQNAEILGLYAEIAKKINPRVRFSVYSGYPPISNTFYGIDWKKLSPRIDLCMVGYGGDDALMLRQIKQKFFNTGLLLMGHVDSTQTANTLTEFLCNAGSYMCYLHHTSDGGFFRNSSVAAAIAAGFEPFFTNLKDTGKDELTSEVETGKSRGDTRTFRHNGETVVILMNTSGVPKEYHLKTSGVASLDAVQFSSGKKIRHNNDTYSVTVAPYSSDAVYFCRLSGKSAPKVPVVFVEDGLAYPVFRWKAGEPSIESYDVRCAETERSLENAKISSVSEPHYQVPKKYQGRVFCQVRTVFPDGRKSAWSTPSSCVPAAPELLKYHCDKEAFGSLRNSGITQFYSWGGGSQFAEGKIDTETVAPGDKASLKIVNVFDTMHSYWTVSRGRGCHYFLREVKPGEKYFFSAKLKTEGTGKASICISALDANGNIVQPNASSKTISGDAEWTDVIAERSFPPNAKYMNLYFNFEGIGSAWCSDIKTGKK